jgi:hypothetical protein
MWEKEAWALALWGVWENIWENTGIGIAVFIRYDNMSDVGCGGVRGSRLRKSGFLVYRGKTMSHLADAHRALMQAEGRFQVDVYREHADWDRYDRWWKLTAERLGELFVGRWECGEYQADELVDSLRAKYPDHVLVY